MTEAQKKRFAGALTRLSGDEEMLETLASIASEDAPGMIETMDSELENKNLDAYAKSAHAVKGLLSTFETGEPVSEMQPAIDAARQGDVATTKATHDQFRSPLKKLVEEINELAG